MPSFKFHFQEIDWVVYVPSHGNERRTYQKYGVAYHDRKKGRSQPGRRIGLKEALEKQRSTRSIPTPSDSSLNPREKARAGSPITLEPRRSGARGSSMVF